MLECRSCGFVNADGIRFCGGCGASLEQIAPARGRERKVVTVLFCDLVGFTAASDGADPEDVQAALTPYHARARLEIERFGGTVEKFIGDAVMAAFGAPVVHEDDAERAVRAGLRLLTAVEELNAQHGLDLTVRIGVATGGAVVSTGAHPELGEGMLAGDVVNTAARLQTAAAPGSVVVGEATWRATRRVIDYEELEPVSVKGKSQPLTIWAARGAVSRVGEPLAATTTPLVGRRDELEMLQRAFTRCVREESLQLVTVVAEPGVGKSRLVQEFYDWVDRRDDLVTWRLGKCLPYGESITYWALGQVVKAQAGILDSDAPDVITKKLTEAVTLLLGGDDGSSRDADGGSVPWLVARLGPLVGLTGAEVSRDELFAAWQQFLEAIAVGGPLVVVVEDLHWADPPLLDFWDHLLQWVAGVPMMLVATARPELFDNAPTWGAGHRNATTIGLTALTDAETAMLVTGLLGSAQLPGPTQALLLRRAGGNPMYAEEFVRMLSDRQLVPSSHDVRGAEAAESPDLAEQFPDSVGAVIAARLDTLPTESKSVILDAAVIGDTFWSGAVAALSGRDEREIKLTLHELSQRDYLRPSRSSTRAGQSEYTFAHALISEVAYRQLPRADRARKHRAAADWLTSVAAGDGGELAGVIAHHYDAARTLLEMSGNAAPADASGLADLASHWHTAGERATALDGSAAQAHFEAALALTPTPDRRRANLLDRLSVLLSYAGEYEVAEVRATEAAAELRSLGDIEGQALAGIHRSYALRGLGRGGEGMQALDEAIELLEELPPGPVILEGYSHRAATLFLYGRLAEARDAAAMALTQCRELGDAAKASTVVRLLTIRGLTRCWLGDADGRRDVEEGIELARQETLVDAAVAASMNLASAVRLSDPVESLAIFSSTLALARERGRSNQAYVTFTMGIQAETLAMLGRLDEALDVCRQAAGGDPSIEATRDTLQVDVIQAQVLTVQGAFERAAVLLEQILPALRNLGEPAFLVPAVAAAILCAAAAGEDVRVDTLVDEMVAVLDPASDGDSCQYLPEIARILARSGHRDVVLRVAAAAPLALPLMRNGATTAQAVVAEVDGDLGAAQNLYERAVTQWEDFGNPIEQGAALLGAVRCQLALGDAYQESLAAAREIFVRCGAGAFVAEADRLLA